MEDGQIECFGPEDHNNIRYLGLNTDIITNKRSTKELPKGSITINQLEYVVETLAKFESQFQLKLRTSAGDRDFGKSSELPPQAVKEYEHAVKEKLKLVGTTGSLNWLALRGRPD
eukprot:2500614-Amphidinium_carterae.1